MTIDHYAALGLGSHASLADIKKAFRQKERVGRITAHTLRAFLF